MESVIRRYEYVLPSFAFDPSVGMAREDSAAATSASTPATTTTTAASPFVFDDGVRARLNALLKRYVGTHNFHNFTIRVRPSPNSLRVTYGTRSAASEARDSTLLTQTMEDMSGITAEADIMGEGAGAAQQTQMNPGRWRC